MEEETTEPRTRRSLGSRIRRILGTVLFPLVLVVGWVLYSLVSGPSVDGRVLLHESAPITLGPNGWVAIEQDAGWWPWGDDTEVVMRNVVTGEETNLGEDPRLAHILPTGGYLSDYGGIAIHAPSGEQIARIESEQIGAGVEGLAGLQAGSPEIAGVSEQVVAVLVCYAPERELLSSDAAGGHAVMAGYRLSDGQKVWARDTGAGCAGRELYRPPVSTMGAIEHMVTYAGDQATVTRLDDGSISATWSDTPKDSVVLQDGLALHRIGDSTVEVVDLASGDVLATTECADVGLMGPGPMANLSSEAVLAVECGAQEVRLYDRDAQEFLTVDAPPLGEERLIPDGGSVAYDRYVLSREGSTVTLTDALSGTKVGTFTAEADMVVQSNAPRGRLLLMYETTNHDKVQYRQVVVDLRTAETLVSDSKKLGPHWQVDPTGFAMVSSGDFYETGGRYGSETEYRVESWVVGLEGEPTDG